MDVAIPRQRQRVTSPSSTTHTYTERTYHYGGRRADGDHRQTCGGSCVGAVFGVLLCLGGSVLLWYNEGVAVRTARSLDEAMKHLSSAGAADAAEGALVHASGRVTAQVLRDDQFGLSPLEAVSLERVVEVRQWKESSRKHTRTVGPDNLKETTTTYTYEQVWSTSAISSSRFHKPGHENPHFDDALAAATSAAGYEVRAARWTSDNVRVDGILLHQALRSQLSRSQLARPPAGGAHGMRAVGDHLYSPGCAPPSAVGCARLSWKHVPPPPRASVVGARRGDGIAAWPSSQPGYEVALLAYGARGAVEMLSDAQSENTMLTWLKRGGGWLLLVVGWSLILGPAKLLASYIPLLGRLVGCALAVVGLSVASGQALVIVAVAWIYYRPLLAAVLLALGVVCAGAGVFGVARPRENAPNLKAP